MNQSNKVIEVANLSKQYRLGEVSTGTIAQDMNRWWARVRGKDDPTLRLTHANDRAHASEETQEFVWAIRDINFEVRKGEVLGVIGKNGAGKSTLLKIMSRVTAPTEGEVRVDGRIASLLEVGTGFHPELTGRENIFLNGAILGMSKIEIMSKLDEIVEFSGCARYLDTPVKRYSSGMIVRLGFAVAAHLEPEILIVDEVLAVGDAEFRKKCLGKMKDVAGEGRTVIFVSHNMMAVQKLCSRVVWLDQGGVRLDGETAEVIKEYECSALEALTESTGLPAGYIYQNLQNQTEQKYSITGIQLLDESGTPKQTLLTWDYVCFRIHFSATEHVKQGSVVLRIQDASGISLMLCSTEPDANLSCEIEMGDSFADCVFPRWPLSAGESLVNAGLAIPNVELLTPGESLCRLLTEEKNVFHSSSMAPRMDRYVIAAEHHWNLPTTEDWGV